MWAVLRLQDQILPRTESVTCMIGHINFDAKITGKRSAGNPHVAFDEAGDGNVAILAHALARPYLCVAVLRLPPLG
ncbi:hypothetical protein FACS189449_13170 [Alphaproteobacteria bacterium]|nr:hypothetical protein FACS189449_13170 [Alphaproteobacteria bacterium]